MTAMKGTLEEYFETGFEGVVWTFRQDGKSGIDAMVFLEKGDFLTVYNQQDVVIFRGEIEPDSKTGWTEYPGRPGHGQPVALGRWIHWTQKGWRPNAWARLFIRDGKPPLRAELERKIKK